MPRSLLVALDNIYIRKKGYERYGQNRPTLKINRIIH